MFDLEKALESVAPHIAALAAETDRGTFPSRAVEALAQAGLLGLVSSPDVGGQGGTLAAACIAIERIARDCGSTAMILCMHYAATRVIEAHGAMEVRRAIAAGKHVTTLAFSEFGSRSHFWVPIGTAAAHGDEILLTGKKSFVTAAHHADSYVWSSKPVSSSELTTLWLVPRTAAGLRIDGAFDGLGLRGNDSAPVTAEATKVPATARLGDDGAGFAIMMGVVLPWFNAMSASVSAGLMEAAVQRTAAHATATTFAHAGSAIADLPTARAYIARMRIRTDQTKALTADAIAAVATGRADAMLRVLECKAAAGDAAVEVTDMAMRVCGGAAFRKDVGVERAFRDARAAVVMAPTSDVLYDFIGKAVCGLPLF